MEPPPPDADLNLHLTGADVDQTIPNDCDSFLNKENLSEAVLQNVLQDAHDVLLEAIEPCRLSEASSLLTPLDEILKDIYEISAVHDLKNVSANNTSHNEGFISTSSVNPFEISPHSSRYLDNSQSQSLNASTTSSIELSMSSPNSSGFCSFQSSTPQVYSMPPVPPPTPCTPYMYNFDHNQNVTASNIPEQTPSYSNFNFDAAQIATASPYPVGNYYMPYYYGRGQAEPNHCVSDHMPVAPSRVSTPKVNIHDYEYFHRKPKPGKTQLRAINQQQNTDWVNVVPRTKAQANNMVLIRPPLATKKTIADQKKSDPNTNLSQYFDSSSIVIPLLKPRPRKSNENRRKQKIKPKTGADSFTFESSDFAVTTPSQSTRVTLKMANKSRAESFDYSYSDTDLPQLEEIFKRKKRSISGKKDPKASEISVESVKQREEPKQITTTVDNKTYICMESKPQVNEVEDAPCSVTHQSAASVNDTPPLEWSDTDSDDIPLKMIKTMKCSSCKKIFKTSRSLTIHRRKCKIAGVKQDENENDVDTERLSTADVMAVKKPKEPLRENFATEGSKQEDVEATPAKSYEDSARANGRNSLRMTRSQTRNRRNTKSSTNAKKGK